MFLMLSIEYMVQNSDFCDSFNFKKNYFIILACRLFSSTDQLGMKGFFIIQIQGHCMIH